MHFNFILFIMQYFMIFLFFFKRCQFSVTVYRNINDCCYAENCNIYVYTYTSIYCTYVCQRYATVVNTLCSIEPSAQVIDLLDVI